MSEPYVPDGFTRVTPYLSVSGAQKLLDFLVAVFDARIVDRNERRDGKLSHASVQIGDSHIELSDPTEQWGHTPAAIHIMFLTWIKLTDGHSKTARNCCTNRWRWITENAPLQLGIRSETTGISPPIVVSKRWRNHTMNGFQPP